MAPYANFETGKRKPTIIYKEYQQNESAPQKISPVQNNDNFNELPKNGNEEKSSAYEASGSKTLSSKQAASKVKEDKFAQTQAPRDCHVGDSVVVKKMEIKEMKKLQKKHGEWDPKMEQAMGQQGTIIRILPDGDLHVEVSFLIQWIFNPECVELLGSCFFEEGETARFKDLHPKQMKEFQERCLAWIPFMAEFRGQLCTVRRRGSNVLLVQVSNGYTFWVNPHLLVKVLQTKEGHLTQTQRCYTKGDTVQIKDMKQTDLMHHYETHGLKFDNKVLKEKGKKGKVIYVTMGRIIHVRMMRSSSIIVCCPPILDLKQPTTHTVHQSEKDLRNQIMVHRLLKDSGVIIGKSHNFATGEVLLHLGAPDDMPQDAKDAFLKQFVGSIEANLKDFFENQDGDKHEQNVKFQVGDRVSVKKMPVFEFMMNQMQETIRLEYIQTVTMIGKQGFIYGTFTDSEELLVQVDGFESPVVFNSDCIELVEKGELHHFKTGQAARFRNIDTKEMQRLQEHHGGWVPLIKDMKNKECSIVNFVGYMIEVKMLDGYTWLVNPKLLESFDQPMHRGEPQRCFKVGDKVKIKDKKKDELKKHNIRHGLPWENEIFRSIRCDGEVVSVDRGRIIHVRLKNGSVLLCCRPILELVKAAIEDEGDARKQQEARQMRILESTSGRSLTASSPSPGVLQWTLAAYSTPRDLLTSSATGNVEATIGILNKHPLWVDAISDDGEQTALMNACAAGDIESVKLLVEAGARVDLENVENNTATIVAAWKGEKAVLKYLLDKGSKLCLQNSEGVTALHAAILGDSDECVDLLLERCTIDEFHIRDNDGMTPTTLVVALANKTICEKIFSSKHFKASYKDDSGTLALHAAALFGNENAVKRLLEMHPEGVNQQKQDLWTPLHLAAYNNKIEVLKILLSHKNCNTNVVNEDEETPLFLAVKRCNKQVVDLLLEANADPNIPNEDGETCLHQVFKLQEKSMDQPLQSPVLPPNDVVVLPSKSQWLELARLLVSKGAEVDVKDTSGETPLDQIKDELFKAEILTQVDAQNSVGLNLKDFYEGVRDVSTEEKLQRVYQTSTFAARYFDDRGGYLEVEKANVRMYIPPGAIKKKEQLIYINLDPVHSVKGKISPVVEVGPPGTTFERKVTLSYPHCAANESEWKFSTLISQQSALKSKGWKDVLQEEGVESYVKNGRTVIKTPHFTRFTTVGEPKSKETPAKKNMRIGAFGKDHQKGTNTYQFRVRTWDDTAYATQTVRDKETKYLKTKPIDDDRPLLVRNTNEDVSVKVKDVKRGWKQRSHQGKEQRLKFSDVWENKLPSCTVNLDKTDGKVHGHDVHCRIKANQLKTPDTEHVQISISPETVDGVKEETSRRDNGQYLEEHVFGVFPDDLPGMPKQLYLDLCGLINVKDDVNGDWRTIMAEMGNMNLIDNVENKQRSDNDSPANFALRHYLYECRATEGSDNPINDLKDLFKKKELHHCLRCVREYEKEIKSLQG